MLLQIQGKHYRFHQIWLSYLISTSSTTNSILNQFFIKFILKITNTKRIIVPLNYTLSYLQAFGFTYLVPGNIFTLDNLKSLQIDNISSDGLKGKTTIEEIVPSYLSKKNNKLDTYRKNAGR